MSLSIILTMHIHSQILYLYPLVGKTRLLYRQGNSTFVHAQLFLCFLHFAALLSVISDLLKVRLPARAQDSDERNLQITDIVWTLALTTMIAPTELIVHWSVVQLVTYLLQQQKTPLTASQQTPDDPNAPVTNASSSTNKKNAKRAATDTSKTSASKKKLYLPWTKIGSSTLEANK